MSINWKRRGQAIPHFPASHPQIPAVWDAIDFSWPGLLYFQAPGLYRITVTGPDQLRWVYIGEGTRLGARLGDYLTLHGSKPGSTSYRLTRLVRDALVNGRPVYLDTAQQGFIEFHGIRRRLAMRRIAERQLAEAAAIIQECEIADKDTTAVLNKVVHDSEDSIWVAEYFEEP